MSTGLGSKRWLWVTLLIALFCLFSFADLQAKSARPVGMVPIVPCHLGELDSDPWMFGAEPVAPCAGLEVPEVQSVYLFGDLALMRVVVGDEVESHVYRRTGTRWERIHVMSGTGGTWAAQGAAYEDYLMELENASAGETQDVGFALQPAIRSSDNIWTVEYEMTGNELQRASEGGTGWESIQFAPMGDAYLEYLFELETSETDR